ncbi:MAG: cbb3-type cytochrome c oxidase subunit I [Opitutaceae bacterium]|jgi:cytochrome c oxidase cbb3-type subunit 1|nr:cbb3-type cytochrome c oxidase subunit I [Opitutaceae bacterium]
MSTQLSPPPPAALPPEFEKIDASARAPLTLFLVSAVLWLLAGTTLALISAFKLHDPQFLGDCEWLTFGRVRAAHLNAVIHGWSTNAAFAVALWLMARLSRSMLRHGGILLLAGALWNIGVTIGVAGILKGDSTSVAWLEIPPYATPLLLIASVLIGAWAIITLRLGKSKHIHVSQWYLLAALFWFPWLCSVAQLMLILEPARGTVQALVNWWFAHNLIGLWFTPVALGAIYYFLPKVLGKPIHSRHLALLGFWTLAIFQGWAGVRHLTGGPVPAWAITAGIAASFMMIVPVAVTAINCHLTMTGSFSALKHSPTLRFIVFGAVNYTLAGLIDPLMAARAVSRTLHFTHFTIAHAHHGMYAFFTMVMFGGIYYILPRILLREWPNATLIRVHFWACAAGGLLCVASLSIGGIVQGLMMNATNPDGLVTYKFMEVIQALIPYLFSRSVAGILITVGHLAFAVNLFWMLAKKRAPQNTAPTLFSNPEEMEPAIK